MSMAWAKSESTFERFVQGKHGGSANEGVVTDRRTARGMEVVDMRQVGTNTSYSPCLLSVNKLAGCKAQLGN